jgi:hypothetical protein
MPEFDAYLIVDWSASSVPARGADSVWYCLLTRIDDRLSIAALENPPTRSRAVAEIREILRREVKNGRSTLAGFDFPYGYPSGLDSALGLDETPSWLAVWREISTNVVDRDDNENNRFEVAAGFNNRISNAAYPFWGCPDGCIPPMSVSLFSAIWPAPHLVENRSSLEVIRQRFRRQPSTGRHSSFDSTAQRSGSSTRIVCMAIRDWASAAASPGFQGLAYSARGNLSVTRGG